MKKQPITTANLGGLDLSLDPVFLANTSSPNLSLVRFDKGVLYKDVGRRAFGSGNLGNTVVYISTFPLRNGTIHYLFVTTEQLFKLLANSTFSAINDANYTGNSTDRFTSCITVDANGSDLYIITNGVDPVKSWGGSGNIANLAGLANLVTSARFVTSFKNRCILGFTEEGGQQQTTRVRWSKVGDPEEWSDANYGCGFAELIDSPDWITAFLLYKERLLVFKEHSIWELVYTGNVTNPFVPRMLMQNVGTLSPYFPIAVGDFVIFFGTDDLYLYDTYSLTPLSKPVHPLFYYTNERILNINSIATARAAFVEELNEYWLSIPTVGQVPDVLFKYNLNNKQWTKSGQEVTAFGVYSIGVGIFWKDGVGTWANATDIWMEDKSASGAPTTLMGDSSGNIWEDDRLTPSSDSMIYETKDFMWAHAQRIIEIRVQAKFGPFLLSYSTDGGLTWSSEQEFAYVDEFTEFVLYCNLTTKTLRIRIRSFADWCEIKWIEPWYIPRARTTELSVS